MVRVAVTVREVGMHVLQLFAPVLMTMLAAGFNRMILLCWWCSSWTCPWYATILCGMCWCS